MKIYLILVCILLIGCVAEVSESERLESEQEEPLFANETEKTGPALGDSQGNVFYQWE